MVFRYISLLVGVSYMERLKLIDKVSQTCNVCC